MKNICKTLDKLNSTYDNLALLGDFNAEPEKESISELLNLYNLRNLVKQNICFKNPDKPTCIDLILTNSAKKQHFPKQKPNVVIHQEYKNLHNDYFRIELENVLLKYDFNNIDYDNFIETFLTVLDKHAPI